MIDFTLDEIMELARQAQLQKRVEADGVKAPEPEPVVLPEDLRGKLGVLSGSDELDEPFREEDGDAAVRAKLLRGAHHLIWVWFQYGGGFKTDAGVVCLPHKNMQAGEQATEYLEALGLGSDDGYHFELNEFGMAVFNAGEEA